jgi:hypothetical protein
MADFHVGMGAKEMQTAEASRVSWQKAKARSRPIQH